MKPLVPLLLFLSLAASEVWSQQFPSDRIYMEHYDRKECQARVEAEIERIKRAMLSAPTGQHQQFLNNQSRTLARTTLPMTNEQIRRANQPQQPNLIDSGELTVRMMARFDAMRRSCR